MISTNQVEDLMSGGTVVGSDGAKIGKVGQVYMDDSSGQPEWVTVKTGMFGSAESFIPLAQANANGSEIQVPYDKDKVKNAPRMSETDEHLSPEQENDLYRYYGLTQPSSGGQQDREPNVDRDAGNREGMAAGDDRRDRTGEAGMVGKDTSGPTTDDAMTRSEEQLSVGKESRESGKARLRKYVVTENVTQTVPVSHEEVTVSREPITEANRGEALRGGDLTEEEHEVTLHEERAVVDKETVPVERVRMDTETVTENQQVDETVRKEQIETDTTDAPGENKGTGRDQGNR